MTIIIAPTVLKTETSSHPASIDPPIVTEFSWWRAMALSSGAAIATLILLTQSYFFFQLAWWTVIPPRQTQFMTSVLDADQAPALLNAAKASAAKKSALRQNKDQTKLKAPAKPITTQPVRKVKPLSYQWTPYAAISIHIKRAVIASEDSHFAEHTGVDWQGIEQAIKKNKRKGRSVSGGSTISQQLAKNLFLSSERSYVRKGQELVITKMLEFWMDKTRILELYLNVAQWGDHLYGIEAASQHYFNISAAELNADQAARLAVLLPAPTRYGKNIYSGFINARTNMVLTQMPSSVLP